MIMKISKNKNQCPDIRDSRLAAKSLRLGVYDPNVKLFTSQSDSSLSLYMEPLLLLFEFPDRNKHSTYKNKRKENAIILKVITQSFLNMDHSNE